MFYSFKFCTWVYNPFALAFCAWCKGLKFIFLHLDIFTYGKDSLSSTKLSLYLFRISVVHLHVGPFLEFHFCVTDLFCFRGYHADLITTALSALTSGSVGPSPPLCVFVDGLAVLGPPLPMRILESVCQV